MWVLPDLGCGGTLGRKQKQQPCGDSTCLGMQQSPAQTLPTPIQTRDLTLGQTQGLKSSFSMKLLHSGQGKADSCNVTVM